MNRIAIEHNKRVDSFTYKLELKSNIPSENNCALWLLMLSVLVAWNVHEMKRLAHTRYFGLVLCCNLQHTEHLESVSRHHTQLRDDNAYIYIHSDRLRIYIYICAGEARAE